MGVIGNLMFAVGFKVTNKAIQNADKDIQKLRGNVDGVDKSISGLGAGFTSFAAVSIDAAAAVGLAVLALGNKAINAAENYERAMGRIQGATGATSEQMVEVRGIADELYKQNYGENWDDLAGSLSKTKQITKLTGDELKETARDALLLRDNPDIGFEISESLRTARGMMKTFGIESKQAYNLMAQGAQEGLDANGNLLDSSNEYGAHFKALGFAANEMFDVFGAGIESGAFDLDKVGDAVKEFNIRAKDGSKTTIDAFTMLGLNADKMMKTFASGGPEAKQAFSQIMSMINDIEDPVDRNTVAVNLMGTQYEDLQTIIGAFAEGVQRKFDMTRATMEELNQTKVDAPGQAFKILGRQIETGILRPIGEKLLPLQQKFTEWIIASNPLIEGLGALIVGSFGLAADLASGSMEGLNQAILWSTQFFNDHQFAIQIVAGLLLTVFGPALLATGAQALWTGAQITAGFIASMVTAAWQTTVTSATITGQGIMALVRYAAQGWVTVSSIVGMSAAWLAQKTAIGISTGLTWAMTAAQWALNAAFWANPMTWVIAGIIALVGVVILMITHWDLVKQKASEVWGAIKEAWGNVTSFLGSIDLIQTGKDIISGLIKGIVSMGSALWETAKGIGSTVKDSITDFLGIHSPSRVMMDVGFWTGEGLVEGLSDTDQRVSGAAEMIAEETVSPFDGTDKLPSAAPAPAGRSTISGGSSSEITLRLMVEVKGDTPVSKDSAGNIAEGVKSVVQEAVESAIRRLGISPEVVM